MKFLCKGTVYVKVCSQVFQSEEIKSTWGVIQKLSKEGLYVIDTNDEAVTEERLSQSDEFDLVCEPFDLFGFLAGLHLFTFHKNN